MADVKENPEQQEGEEQEDVVNPFTVESKSQKGVDYDKLISKYYYYILV